MTRLASSSCTVVHWSLLIVSVTIIILMCSACSKPSRHGSHSTDSWPSLKCLHHLQPYHPERARSHLKYLCHTFINAELITSYPKAFWIIWMVSMEKFSSLTQTLMQIPCSTHSVDLNVKATQYTCSLNSIYHSHWPVQWSCNCSRRHIPVHSPWLPGYMEAVTILVVLTMAGFFPDRPPI